MYQGNNITAIQSMDWLSQALMNLIRYTPYSKITIRDLCLSADLSRQTFYNVFDSKDEVMHYCLQEKYRKQFVFIIEEKALTIDDIIDAFISFQKENHFLLDYMIDNHLEGIITEEISNCISLYVKQFVRDSQETEMLPYSIALLSGALAQLQLYLFKQEAPIDSNQIANLLHSFFHGTLYQL